jgi:hypothetical protein
MIVKRSAVKIQNKHWLREWNIRLHCLDGWRIGIMTGVTVKKIRAKTPPNLLGVDHKLA